MHTKCILKVQNITWLIELISYSEVNIQVQLYTRPTNSNRSEEKSAFIHQQLIKLIQEAELKSHPDLLSCHSKVRRTSTSSDISGEVAVDSHFTESSWL